ncbi:MAG: GNAT family N-acetyltransferase, partial [Bacteroidales bacterium]|nr:GNAT family N-acetyltransferase [Bacteroidales bacterium]
QNLPTILLGRLAIDKSFQGKGYGEVLLVNALNRCIKTSENLGALAVVVDPIDENAINFYIKYGFIMLPGSQKMFITIKTIEDSL